MPCTSLTLNTNRDVIENLLKTMKENLWNKNHTIQNQWAGKGILLERKKAIRGARWDKEVTSEFWC